NVFPIRVQEDRTAGAKEEGESLLSRLGFSGRIRPTELAVTTRQLATLIGAGLPLVGALDSVISQSGSHSGKRIMSQVKDGILEGKSLAESLGRFPGTFSTLYTNMVHAGETSGTLEIVLNRLADITERQQALTNRIRAALTYPILMTVVGLFVLVLLLTYVVPRITSIFSSMNQVLPLPTRILIQVSGFMAVYWWLLLVGAAALLLALRVFARTQRGKRFFDTLRLRLPVIRSIQRKLVVTRFARTLGSLLENGVTMLTALDVVRNISGNVLVAEAIEEASRSVKKGMGLADALAATGVFPALCIQMIQVGEKSGELEPILAKVADAYENELETLVVSATALLEPMLILVMGAIVGFIVLSVCLPIFEMNQLVR
ncbi:MAG: type II secretion system F family protein, partial [Desulfobacteraceae bacterium]|nr:type II secretion system F family protein [Desulfobacteraceae bacterium]